MKIILALIPAFAGMTLCATAHALSIPDKPEKRVNDYAGLLAPAVRAELESTLAEFEKETTNQIVVAVFNGLEGESLEDFSVRLAEKWKIGSAKNDNGVILLIFKNDRKIRIEVGYGLEGVLPDALADQIIRREIAPSFREQNFDLGVKRGVEAILRATQGEYSASKGGSETQHQILAQFAFFALILYFVAPLVGCLVIVGLCTFFLGWPGGFLIGLFISIILFALGTVVGWMSGKTLSGRRGWFVNGFSSGSFGGGFGGGSGGGFGGGGGGSFGGGGSSGGW